ncbi:hypothetical protein HYR69_12195 [Candidatus Sumerlaeota bacterium]|nr:hypothetical protein [Candidatus Sumerlaeota bacterium]
MPLVLFLASGLFLPFAALAWLTRSDFLDDAYISFRYARHLAEGRGLVWNVGDRPIEGFTNLLHTLFAAGLLRAGLAPEIIGPLLSGAAAFIMFVYLVRFAALKRFDPYCSYVLLLAVALNPFLAANAGNGLETIEAAAIGAAVSFYAAAIVVRGPSPWRVFVFGLTAFLGGLTRPDLLLLAAAPLAVSFWLTRAAWRTWIAVMTGFVIAGVGFLIFKKFYFGAILPLPFYVKQGGLGFNPVTAKDVIALFIRFFPVALMVPFVLDFRAASERNILIVLAASALLFMGYHCTVAVPVMGFGYRFFCPVMPILGLMGLLLAPALSVHPARRRFAAAMLVITLVTPLSAIPKAWGTMGFNDLAAYREFARALRQADPGPRTLAIGDAGVIPYLTDWRVVDLNRLNDPILARHPERNVEVVFAQNPELVMPGVDPADFERHYLRGELLKRGYVLIGLLRTGGHPPLAIYARSDYAASSAAEEIRRRWGAAPPVRPS